MLSHLDSCSSRGRVQRHRRLHGQRRRAAAPLPSARGVSSTSTLSSTALELWGTKSRNVVEKRLFPGLESVANLAPVEPGVQPAQAVPRVVGRDVPPALVALLRHDGQALQRFARIVTPALRHAAIVDAVRGLVDAFTEQERAIRDVRRAVRVTDAFGARRPEAAKLPLSPFVDWVAVAVLGDVLRGRLSRRPRGCLSR